MGKVRFQVYLEPRQIQAIKNLAFEKNISLAQELRELVDSGLSMQAKDQANRLKVWTHEGEFIDAWMANAKGYGERTWRREDTYDVE